MPRNVHTSDTLIVLNKLRSKVIGINSFKDTVPNITKHISGIDIDSIKLNNAIIDFKNNCNINYEDIQQFNHNRKLAVRYLQRILSQNITLLNGNGTNILQTQKLAKISRFLKISNIEEKHLII